VKIDREDVGLDAQTDKGDEYRRRRRDFPGDRG
jgi:hypothetical protein